MANYSQHEAPPKSTSSQSQGEVQASCNPNNSIRDLCKSDHSDFETHSLSVFAHEPRPLRPSHTPSLFRAHRITRSLSPASTHVKESSRGSFFPDIEGALRPSKTPIASSQGRGPFASVTSSVENRPRQTLFAHTLNRGQGRSHAKQGLLLKHSKENYTVFSSSPYGNESNSSAFCSGSTPSYAQCSRPSQSKIVHRNHLSISSHMGRFTLGNVLSEELTPTQSSSVNFFDFSQPPIMDRPRRDASAARTGSHHIAHHQQTTDESPGEIVESILVASRGEDTSGFNIDNFLLLLLQKLDASLPLDDFYNILYNPKHYDALRLTTTDEKIDRTIPSGDLTTSIDILKSVIETFRVPETLHDQFSAADAANIKPYNVNLHELLRSFLALKILHHSLIEDGGAESSAEHLPIPRLDIYKVYYILCQKLILKYPTSSNTTSLQQKLIFGQSKLGKLIKLVYPNLVSKRLGSRGMSRYNYLGVRWNTNIVNDEIKALSKDSLEELTELFRVSKRPREQSQSSKGFQHERLLSQPPAKRQHTSNDSSELISSIKAHGTFVEPNHFFPAGPFTSKAFLDEELTNDYEKNWFAAAIKTSSDALKEAKISPDTIEVLLFGESTPAEKDNASLLRGIVDQILPQLLESSKQTKVYLHLFTLISLKVFPHLLSLRKLPHTDSIQRLVGKVQNLIEHMEAEIEPRFGEKMDLQDAKNFLGILSRMMHLNKLLASFFKADLQEFILREMQEDIIRVVTEGSKEGMNETYRLISEALSSVLLAYRYKPQFRGTLVDINIKEFLFDSCRVIEQMVSQDLAVFVTNIMAGWVPHTEENNKSALKFRLLLATLELADEGILNENMKARFPAFIIRGLYSKIAMEMLQFTYRAHASMLGSNPANPTFRLWYVLESFIQEYLDVLAELNSLHLVAVDQ